MLGRFLAELGHGLSLAWVDRAVRLNERSSSTLSSRFVELCDSPAPDKFRACAQHAQRSAAQQMSLDVERVVKRLPHVKISNALRAA